MSNTNIDKVYIFLSTLFASLVITGNLIYQKFVAIDLLSIYTIELSVGAMMYPATFLLTDLISEFYGAKYADFCVKLSICMNIIIAIMIHCMDTLNATTWSNIDDATFHKVFGMYGINFIGSILACYISQSIDIRLYMFIRKVTNNKYLWLRSNVSTAVSLLVDTSIVISFLTIFGVLSYENMLSLIINSYMFKLLFTICSTPIFYLLVYITGYARRIDAPQPSTVANHIKAT
jgi:uncharacterized integral membrane protein (TIGR00697 family)